MTLMLMLRGRISPRIIPLPLDPRILVIFAKLKPCIYRQLYLLIALLLREISSLVFHIEEGL